MSKPDKRAAADHRRQLAYLEYLLDFDLGLLQHINDWQEGFPAATGSNGTGSTPKGGHGDRVAAEATRGYDASQPPARSGHGMADEANELHKRILEAVTYLRDLARDCRRSGLKPLNPGLADLKARSADPRGTGVGYCAVDKCDHLCSGGLNDQLKSGLCPKCYRAWMRNLDTDQPLSRQTFIDTRTPRVVTVTNDEGETAGCPADPENVDTLRDSGGPVRPSA